MKTENAKAETMLLRVVLTKELCREIDARAKSLDYDRSKFVRKAIRDLLKASQP